MLTPMTTTPPPAETPDWFNRDNAARYLGVSHMTIWRAVRDGLLPKHTIGGRTTRYSRAELDAYARGQTRTALTPAAVTATLDAVRARIPTGRPLITVTAVHDILDTVARDLGGTP